MIYMTIHFCPVCKSNNLSPFLLLSDFPVYLHANARVMNQRLVDLRYSYCNSCGHAFIPDYDKSVLEDIYSHHYWGKDVENIAYTQREDFIDFYCKNRCKIDATSANVLEIGCSSGQMMFELMKRYPVDKYFGYEPNVENAETCCTRGFFVENKFFTQANAKSDFKRKYRTPFDAIYHRHVIEHIFDFDDFFHGIDEVAGQETVLFIETPSLEQNIKSYSLDPFHHEHIHVFSLSSLVNLAYRFGWLYQESMFTDLGNMIVCFSHKKSTLECTSSHSALSNIVPLDISIPEIHQFNVVINSWKNRLINEMSGKRLVFWGAGSYCTLILSLCGISPDKIIDGNPNKCGEKMAGSSISIENAERAVASLIAEDDMNVTIVVTSSFHKEITDELSRLGWQGQIIIPSLLIKI